MNERLRPVVLVLLIAVVLAQVGCDAAEQSRPATPPTEQEKQPEGEGGKVFELKSAAFEDGERMPAEYANRGVQGGENLSPPLEWAYAPEGTESFAIAMIDHHPVANEFVHWLVVNVPGSLRGLKRGASGTDQMPPEALELKTSYGSPDYGGPRPPAGTGDHPYETTIYALSARELDLTESASLDDFLRALEGKVLAKASLTGHFSQ